MADREKAIKTLEDMINIAESLKNRDFITKTIILNDEKVESLKFALESLKVDASDKTDRGEVITTLTEHLNHWKRLLSEGICCEVEGKQTIDALNFAIESIKVDRAYDLAYEKVDFIEIPEETTNGEVFEKLMREAYPKMLTIYRRNEDTKTIAPIFNEDWWNSLYRKEQE